MSSRFVKSSPDRVDIYVGAQIRRRRQGLRISQSALGKLLGITFQQIQKYENGSNRIGASNLYKIAHGLGVKVGDFFEGIPSNNEKYPDSVPGISESAQVPFAMVKNSRESTELIHNYFSITDPEIKKQLHHFVRSLATKSANQ